MKAFVKYGEKPYEAGLRDVPLRSPGPEDILIRVAGCGVCGSDLHAYKASSGYEWVKPPVTLGHEFTGRVDFVPPGVGEFCPGDRVVVIGIQGCGTCRFCRGGDTHLCLHRKVIGLDLDGGMAPEAWVNRRHLIRLPDGIDSVVAALTEPLSVAVHALSKVQLRPCLKTVVSGPGPIGLLCATVAASSGASVMVCGTSADETSRLPAARTLGFDAVNIDQEPFSKAVPARFGSELPDLWIEASGSVAAFQAAIGQLSRGGTLLAVGMYAQEFPFFASAAVRSELSFQFSYASAYRDYAVAVEFMREGGVDLNVLAQPFPLDRADEVFREAEAGRTLKPILVP